MAYRQAHIPAAQWSIRPQLRHLDRQAIDHGVVLVADINARLGRAWPTDLFALIAQGLSEALAADAFATGLLAARLLPRAWQQGVRDFASLQKMARQAKWLNA